MKAFHRAAMVGIAVLALSGPLWAAQNAAKPNAAAGIKGGTQSAAGGQYSTEAAAKSHCPSDMVVWANNSSKIFHFAESRD